MRIGSVSILCEWIFYFFFIFFRVYSQVLFRTACDTAIIALKNISTADGSNLPSYGIIDRLMVVHFCYMLYGTEERSRLTAPELDELVSPWINITLPVLRYHILDTSVESGAG